MSEKLNDRQARFAMEYPTDYNATQAAIRAGYSPKTAGAKGFDLLKKVEIQNAIKKRQKEITAASFVTQERVVQELAKIAFFDVNDYVEVQTAEFDDEDDETTVPMQCVRIRTDVPHSRRAPIVGIKETKSGIELKLADKMKALELLGKYAGVFEAQQSEPPGAENNLLDAMNSTAPTDWDDRDDKPEEDDDI